MPQLENTPLSQLKPHPQNPRRGNVGKIKESLEVNGQYRPIVASRRTGHVLAGNHTLAAAKELGLLSLEVYWVDVDEDGERRILLADNRTSDTSTYDRQSLEALLEELATSATGFAGTGYSGEDVDVILAQAEAAIGQAQAEIQTAQTQQEYVLVVGFKSPEARSAVRQELEAQGYSTKEL